MNNIENNSLSSNKNIHFDIDSLNEFQIDENSFKPVTKGLGFHQETKRKQFAATPVKATRVSVPSVPHKNQFELGKSISKSFDSNIQDKQNLDKNLNRTKGALAAFYGEQTIPDVALPNVEEERSSKIVSRIEAAAIPQGLAFLVDVLLVLSFTVATLAALVVASRIEFNILIKIISQTDQIVFGSSLFVIYFLLYFTILDLNATPGKSIFGLRLYRADGKDVSVKHTLGRALITLFSVVTMMLPTLLDFQGRLSGTKVFKDN